MEIKDFFKAVVDSDNAPVVVCDLQHTIIYMNPTAVERYKKRGGAELVGSSLLDCHNEKSNIMIKKVVEWFGKSAENNRIFTFRNDRENKDVYMIALRDGEGGLIGYYEKHEFRNPEISTRYNMD
ncbi:MAG: fatty acid/phospholipid synthesis protein PlsX [Ruminococcus sp.]|nr:fatty acid/phospholipid synthesis protein PlsX [Ruminococcus sp.]